MGGREGGRLTVTWLPNFLGWVELLTHGAPLLDFKTTHSDGQDGFPTIALLLLLVVFYNKKYYHLQCNTQGGCVVVLTTKLSFPSLRRRGNLTSVSNVCDEEPISLFWAPNGLPELPEKRFEFPIILIGKSTVAFLTGRSLRVLTSWYTDRARNFDAVSPTDLTRVL